MSIFDVELHLTHLTHRLLTKETQSYIESQMYKKQNRAFPALNLRSHLPNIREATNAQDFCKTKKDLSIHSALKWTLVLMVQIYPRQTKN